MGKSKTKQLSQAEVWDDSALLRSWDEALAEYKKYHSLQARGETVDIEMQTEEEPPSTRGSPAATKIADGANNALQNGLEDLEDGEVGAEDDTSVNKEIPVDTPALDSRTNPHYTDKPSISAPDVAQPAIPSFLASGVKDEALRNLMISWYYAGYYTGLYTGQQSGVKPKDS